MSLKLLSVLTALWLTSQVPCAVPEPDTGVLCCCHTRNGLCCAEQTFCGGIIVGCICQ